MSRRFTLNWLGLVTQEAYRRYERAVKQFHRQHPDWLAIDPEIAAAFDRYQRILTRYRKALVHAYLDEGGERYGTPHTAASP